MRFAARTSACRIGRRDELGHDIGRGAEGLIVEHSHIFFDRPSGRFWWQPLLTLDPLLPIGIRLDQTGIDRKGFAADKSLAHAALQDRLKNASQEIALAEAAMPVLREGGMIGDITVEPEPAEPPVSQIEVDFLAETSFGADTEAVPDDEHPNHQLGINRWPSQHAVERRELATQFRQVDKAVDRPQ